MMGWPSVVATPAVAVLLSAFVADALVVQPGAASSTQFRLEGAAFHCRAEFHDGSFGSCSSKTGSGDFTPLESWTSQPAATPLQLLPQEELDVATSGHWQDAQGELPRDSLGSLSRYATCSLYLGPKSDLGKREGRPIPEDVMQAPHDSRFHGGANRSKCHEYEFVSDASANASLHEYAWATTDGAQGCLEDRWIAVWGDSTSRLLFSALVDFLAGGISDPNFPTHDWSFDLHSENTDKCNDVEFEKTGKRCHLAAQIPKSRTTITFNWATKMNVWPNLQQTLAVFRGKEFPELQLRAAPDILLVNSGPWEMYQMGGWTGWIGEEQYTELFSNFLEHEFGALVGSGHGQVSTRLLWLGNTACPKGKALLCRIQGVPCTTMMWDLASLQRRLLKSSAESLGLAESVRWVDSRSLYDPLPDGYRCKGSGFHLPAVVTDARVNHVLHAVCSTKQ